MQINIPPFANVLLQEFIATTIKIKNDFIQGIYLTGSIPLNDYQPGKSDIDFVVLCKEFPDRNIQSQLQEVHKRIKHNFNNENLSGIYLTKDALHVQKVQTTKVISYHEGQMRESVFEMAPITLFELKTTAITLWGMPAENLHIVVDAADVNKFLFENINSYWKNWVDKHASIRQRKLLLVLIPRLTEWVILGLARQLYTLRTGKITSKTEAGFYCLKHLPWKYHSIIQEAIDIRKEKRKHLLILKTSYHVQPSLKRYNETVTCAYFMIDQFNAEYERSSKLI